MEKVVSEWKKEMKMKHQIEKLEKDIWMVKRGRDIEKTERKDAINVVKYAI